MTISRKLALLRFRMMSMRQVFSYVWRNQNWGQAETVSGHGSTLDQTQVLRGALPGLFEELSIEVLLDIPCGDFNWMTHIRSSIHAYVGADIVPELIDANRVRYGNERTRFFCLDITRDALPDADAVFCRDCLVHFSFRDIQRALKNLGHTKSKYLMATTFPTLSANLDIVTGDWRPLNLEAAPLSFPKPIRILGEGMKYGRYGEKCMGVWRLNDLPACRPVDR